MKTDSSPFGRQSKEDNFTLLSQRNFALTGFRYIPNNNNNNANCMNNLTINPKEKLDFPRRKSHNRSYYSSKGLKILMLFGLLLFSVSLFAQNDGDNRSNVPNPPGSGIWEDENNWEVYDDLTGWGPASNYPGEVSGNYDVSILDGQAVILDGDIDQSFNSLTIAGELQIDGNSYLETTLLVITSTGYLDWGGNTNYDLEFPAGTIIIIEEGGLLDTDDSCSANRAIVIGNETFSVCNPNAGNDEISFDELVANGGTIVLLPTSNSPICEGEDLDLDAGFSGADPSDYSISWTGTGPSGYTYSSSTENPTITGLTAGSYTYTVSATILGTYDFEESIDVTVNPISASISNDNGLALSCTIPSTTLTASGGVSYSWSDGISVVGTSADLTVTTAGTFTVTVTGSNGCTATTSVTTTLDNT